MLARAGGRRLPIVPVKRATLKTRANAVSVARAKERLDPLADQVAPSRPTGRHRAFTPRPAALRCIVPNRSLRRPFGVTRLA
jgi:hypothetical protein